MSRIAPFVLFLALAATGAHSQTIGVNVLLDAPPSPDVLAAIDGVGTVLDVLPEINAVTVRAQADEVAAILALPHVLAADPDDDCILAGGSDVTVPDFAAGANLWNLDAVNVTEFGGGRTVPYEGAGVYVAVVDSGLPHNWREYFPEQRIASQFAISFSGGGSEHATVSSQPEKWQNATQGHATSVTAVILGFSYYATQSFNGVAPRATVIPVQTFGENGLSPTSLGVRGILYATSLKTSGALGSSPLILLLSFAAPSPRPLTRAAIDYAIAQGVIVCAAAGNMGDAGMSYPGAYPEVISAGSVGWTQEFPADDPTGIWWILRDVPENDPLSLFVPSSSSRQLPGQDLDVLAPGRMIPVPYTRAGQADYRFVDGTSFAGPHVVGTVALMLQKNPGLTQGQIEAILESTAMPVAPGCRSVIDVVGAGPGNEATWSDNGNVLYGLVTHCWDVNATGSGLLQVAAALNATPMP